jgi:hypothetical protein
LTTDHYIFCQNSGPIVVTLPAVANGRNFVLVNTGQGAGILNTITLAGGGALVNEQASVSLNISTYEFGQWTVSSDGANWFVAGSLSS